MKSLFLTIFLILCIELSFAANYVYLNTTSGLVKGHRITALNKSIDAFIGVPFAEPPVGRLRFAKPEPIRKPKPGIIDASYRKNSCMTRNAQDWDPQSEDCLFVNIWAPKINSKDMLKPVMFWIYGGGFRSGSIFTDYDGKALAAHDVIFVSTNYRLGALGFLYGGPGSGAPGNMAFFDQILALKWVRENIHLFGGNKDMITIFGESAGSSSVSALVVSPLTKGLFKRAIMESGAALHYHKEGVNTDREKALNETKEMIKHFNCGNYSTEWLDCLRKVDAKLINNYDISLDPLDGTEFLPVPAQQAFKELQFNKDVDLIAGVNHNEGSLIAPKPKTNYTEQVFIDLVKQSDRRHILDLQKVKDLYLAKVNTSDPSAIRWAFYDFYGDLTITCSTYLFAKQFAKHSANKNVYFYELTYQDDGKFGDCDEKTMGICHGSELEFVFGKPLLYNKRKLDYDFSAEVMKYWTDFAKTGIPTTSTKWPKMIDSTNTRVKDLNPYNFSRILENPFQRTCDGFWKQYFE